MRQTLVLALRTPIRTRCPAPVDHFHLATPMGRVLTGVCLDGQQAHRMDRRQAISVPGLLVCTLPDILRQGHQACLQASPVGRHPATTARPQVMGAQARHQGFGLRVGCHRCQGRALRCLPGPPGHHRWRWQMWTAGHPQARRMQGRLLLLVPSSSHAPLDRPRVLKVGLLPGSWRGHHPGWAGRTTVRDRHTLGPALAPTARAWAAHGATLSAAAGAIQCQGATTSITITTTWQLAMLARGMPWTTGWSGSAGSTV